MFNFLKKIVGDSNDRVVKQIAAAEKPGDLES